MKLAKNIIASSVALGILLSGTASIAGPSKVSVTGKLAGKLISLNRIEKKQEKDFRKYRQIRPINIKETFKRRNRMQNVEWANEILIPNLDDYSFENVIIALADESLKRAGLSDNGKTYKFEISKLKVSNHSLVILSGITTYVKGRVIEMDENTGKELRSVDVTTNVSMNYSVDWSYDGPDFAFNETDAESRFGPVMVNFISKGLGKLNPNAVFPKPISITYGRL